VLTEVTDIKNVAGCVLFDAECLFCTRLATRVAPLLHRHGFELAPLQTPWAMKLLGRGRGNTWTEMLLLTPERAIYGGADALLELTKWIWWARPLLVGPLFLVRLHVSAWRLAGRGKRVWITIELFAIAGVILFAVCITRWIAPRWHAGAMLAGECLTGFFAVWTVHHGCAAHEPGRTQRGQWLNLISYSMFFHAEHHLFPAVPTAHLQELARRLDGAMPELRQRTVLPFGDFSSDIKRNGTPAI